MVRVRILSWDPKRSWTDWPGSHGSILADRMAGLVKASPGEIKKLARRVLGREVSEVDLDAASDKFAAESIRIFLEALGAEVSVEHH